MTFDDLHLMQQIFLVREYVERDLPLVRPEGCEYHVDEAHGVTINKTHLRTQVKSIWFPQVTDDITDEEIFIMFEVSDYKGVDKVNAMFMSLIHEDSHQMYDKFGLTHDLYVSGSFEESVNKFISLLEPFVESEQLSAVTIRILNKLLATIPKIRTLPDSFFDDVVIDVAAQLVVSGLYNIINHNVMIDKTVYRRHTPIINRCPDNTFEICYERPNTAKMRVTMGLQGPDINVTLFSSEGKHEGGTFAITAQDEIVPVVNSIRLMIIQIVDDCSFKDELGAILRRFLHYFDRSGKHVKNSLRL